MNSHSSTTFRCLMRSGVVIAGAASALACNTVDLTPAPRMGVTEMQPTEPQSFVFAPPPALHVMWTERRTFDVSLVGTQVSEHDESELRWDVSTHPSLYDTTVVNQYLVQVAARHDGRPIVDGVPAQVEVQLVIDAGGTLQGVGGLEGTSIALSSLAEPGMGPRADSLLSPEALRTIVVTRHDLFVGDIVGRPAHVGATWIVPHRPAGNALLRRYTVEGARSCGERACTPVKVHIDLNPRVVADIAIDAIKRHGVSPGEIVPRVRGAEYTMDGEIFVDPNTMATLGATLTDTGRAVVEAPDGSFEIGVHGVTTDTFERPLVSMR